MTLTIGRFSIDDCPYDITHDGDRLSFSLDIDGSTTGGDHEVAKVYRQQLLGLVNNDDEPVVPVTWTDDPDWDGFYRVGAVSMVPSTVYLLDSSSVRHFSVRVDLERVGGGWLVHESYTVAASASSLDVSSGSSDLAVNAAGLVSATIPSTHSLIDDEPVLLGRTDPYGVDFHQIGIVLASANTTGVRASMAASAFYDGSCTIETYVAGSWYPVVGRDVPDGQPVRASNGLVRVELSASGVLSVSSYDGTAWREKLYAIEFESKSEAVDDLLGEPIIYRNDSAGVTLRWRVKTDAGERMFIGVRLSRGFHLAEVSVGTYVSKTNISITRSTTEAATVLQDDTLDTYGVRATSNDANGNRFVLVARETVGSDTTNGGIQFGSTLPITGTFVGAGVVTFGVGLEVDGTSATSLNSAAELGGQFQVASTTSQTIVS